MLIKIGSIRSAWINPDYIESIKIHAMAVDDYHVYINMDGSSYRVDSCDTYEEAVRVMDEAANKINAAQGCKPAAEEKVVMRYKKYGNESSVGVYCCSRCKTMIREEYSWYKFCPACGREIERWE